MKIIRVSIIAIAMVFAMQIAHAQISVGVSIGTPPPYHRVIVERPYEYYPQRVIVERPYEYYPQRVIVERPYGYYQRRVYYTRPVYHKYYYDRPYRRRW